MRSNRIILAASFALLAVTFAIFEFTTLDLWVQDHFYNFNQQTWLVDKSASLPKALFYTGPKWALGITAGATLIWLLLPARWRPAKIKLPWAKRRLWFALVFLAAFPALIGFMKSRSDLYCPWSVERYGGDRPYIHFFDPLPPGFPPDCGNCFPAGHASGGFALLGLYYVGESRRGRWIGFSIGMAAGWAMGMYQMLKGAHFLSHTLVTMFLAMAMMPALAMVFRITPADAARSRAQTNFSA